MRSDKTRRRGDVYRGTQSTDFLACDACHIKDANVCAKCFHRIQAEFIVSNTFLRIQTQREPVMVQRDIGIQARQRPQISACQIYHEQICVDELTYDRSKLNEYRVKFSSLKCRLCQARLGCYHKFAIVFTELHYILRNTINGQTVELWNQLGRMHSLKLFSSLEETKTSLIFTWIVLLHFRIFADIPMLHQSYVSGRLFIRNQSPGQLHCTAKLILAHVQLLLNCCTIPYNSLIITNISLQSSIGALLSCVFGFDHRPIERIRFQLEGTHHELLTDEDWEILDVNECKTAK
ncbi:hypothetical protein ACOME3_004445 [Neoechinorhynchus agilis]